METLQSHRERERGEEREREKYTEIIQNVPVGSIHSFVAEGDLDSQTSVKN
jgi:hypothetical protein